MYVIRAKFRHGKKAYYQETSPCGFVSRKKDAKKFKTIREAKDYFSSGWEEIIKV